MRLNYSLLARIPRRYLLPCVIFLLSVSALSQPANDNCANASVINISAGGFGLGVFNSATYDLTSATVQTGETFPLTFFGYGLNQKSVWYKFNLPTTRSVKVNLSQPGVAIGAHDAGFVVYKANSCLPGNADISTKLTPHEGFDSTFHPCVESGDYLIQVCGKSAADGPVYIKITTGAPTAQYDKQTDAYQFGTLAAPNFTKYVDYTVDCQSTENTAEICTALSNYQQYNKSTWHTFTTPAYFDYAGVLISGTGVSLTSPNSYFINPTTFEKFGYNLYAGDARSVPFSSLILIDGCDSLSSNGYTPGWQVYNCSELQPNTTYSVQFFFRQDFNNNIRVAVTFDGTAPTQAPEPILSFMPASNKLGVLASNSSGIITTATDQLACNSLHSLHPCNPSLPATGIRYNGRNYILSTFFTFTLSGTSRISISAPNFPVPTRANTTPLLMRLYAQDITNTCSSLDTNNLAYPPFFSDVVFNQDCVPPGTYTLQVSGRDTLPSSSTFSYYGYLAASYYVQGLLSDLGKKFTLSINVVSQVPASKYDLKIPGAFDTLNRIAGVMQPLINGVTYNSHIDTFGCANTVLPIDTSCVTGNTKAIYREFIVPDSGVVYLSGSGNNYYKLYKGDADALATAQNVHSFPSRITGLTPYTDCYRYSGECEGQKVCVVPGTYTHVTFGGNLIYSSNPIGQTSQSTVKFDVINTIHDSPGNAENMGTLNPGVNTLTSSLDFFSCKDNAIPINGYQPCTISGHVATKAIYRQFYLSAPATIQVLGYTNFCYSGMLTGPQTVFSGKATDGIAGLTPLVSPFQCFDNANNFSTCNVLNTGWYTVVSYGSGPSYANPFQNINQGFGYSSDVGYPSQVTISATLACPAPKYNRPYKAAIDTITGYPFLIQWAPRTGHTSAYPKTDTTYTLYRENFNCTVDTPFASHPIPTCNASLTKVAYYVFRTMQESYVQINTKNFWGAVYAGNARTDSALFGANTLIQPCLQSSGHIQLCKLQPGDYTLVVFATNAQNCTYVDPTIYIDKTGYSRFDFASKAYDFGVVPPDSVYHGGKVGDVNPIDPGRKPSSDIIYCTTGASPTDPSDMSCNSTYNPNVYNGSTYMYNSATYDLSIPKRNLWYTFVVNEGGTVRIQVMNKTPGTNKNFLPRYAVYRSNVDGSIPFSAVVSAGQVDSTIAQGLTFINSNPYYYCPGINPEISFYRDPCKAFAERYYIIVESPQSAPYDYSGISPNYQVDVAILVDSVNPVQPRFDHYYQVSNIGTNLGAGTYIGATDNYSCATRDATDPVYSNYSCFNKTLWYKFTTTVTGHVKFRLLINGTSYYSWTDLSLYRELIPGDSTSIGLQFFNGSNASIYDNATSTNWGIQCINPGTYYILLSGCNQINAYTHPEIQIIEQTGDFCNAPVIASLNGAGTSVSSVFVDCHTIGTDYGEFNDTLTCPNGAVTTNYKTSWFKIQVTGTDTLDVTSFLTENTNALPTEIKYRLMNGDCGAMQERSCVQDAQTQDTYKCLAPGSYWVQVFTPVLKNGVPVTGTIDLHLSAILHADTCAPSNNCLSNAAFIPQFNCAQNQNVTFANYSTFGSSIQYSWDFGYNGQTSTAIAPQFYYPALAGSQTYTVTLNVLNTGCSNGGLSTYSVPVTIPGRPNVELGNDTTLCTPGSTLLLNATTWPGATYQWQSGSTSPTFTVTAAGANTYWVRVTYNGCIKRDTIKVNINPITAIKQNKVLCGNDSVLLQSLRGYGETYSWNNGSTNSSVYANAGGVYVNAVNWRGCIIRDTFNVTIATPSFANDSTTRCHPFQPFILNATATGAQSYIWQNGSSNPTFTVNSPGLYWVQVNYGNCSIRDSIRVNVSPAAVTDSTNASICSGQIYTLPWGTVVNSANTYRDTLRSVLGCDSLRRIVKLMVQAPLTSTINSTICAGQTYTLPWGTIVNAAGVYRDTLHYTTGCDSIWRAVNLTVQSPLSQTFNPIICAGQPYTLPWGIVVSTSGVYRDTLHFTTGCDSLRRTVNLTVQSSALQATNLIICAGQTYTLPWGTIVNAAGVYRDTLRYTTGCDSVRRTVNLTVQSSALQTTNPIICAGQTYTLPWGAIVNTAGVYRDTLHYTTGCDSIWRAVNLTVQSPSSQTLNPIICAGQTYTLPWGTVVSTSGVYRDTLHYTTGCDSLRRTVNLTVQSSTLQTANPVICAGQTYTLPWGAIVNTAGVYRDTLHYTTGCDSVRRTVNLTVQSSILQTINPIICAGQTYTLPWGAIVNTAGVYRDTLHYTTGCDSIWRAVNLTIQSPLSQTFNPIICAGQTYTLPWGTVVSASGVYRDTLHYTTGCDSLRRTVNLTVQSSTLQATNPVICNGQTYTLPWGTIVNTAGVYRDTLRYTTGCDSVRRTISLTVQSSTLQTTNPIICAGQTYTLPWGAIVNTAGVYRDTLHYTTGCDSIWRTVNLTVQSPTLQTFNPIICAGQTYTLPWGTVVSTSGVYRDTLHYTTGCDSLRRTVNLTVQSSTLQTTNPVICAGQTYTLPWGAIVNSAGVYRDTLHYTTGCDSVRRTVNLTVQLPASVTTNPIICAGQTYTLPWGMIVNTAGVYRDTLHYTSGCDSIRRTVNLTIQSFASVTTNPIICTGQTYTLPWGAIVNSSGIYRDTLHYTTGCDSIRRIVNLTVQSPASQTFSPVICQGGTYTLPWGVVVNTAGTYRDTLHYRTGCDSVRRTINLTVTAAAVSTTSATICSDEIYTLPWGTITNIAGIYKDTVRTRFGCDSLIRTVNLRVDPAPSVSVTRSNDVDCMLGIAKLEASGGVSYTWTPAASLNNAAIYNPIASPTTSTWYKVLVTSDKGCTTEDSVQVKVVIGNIQNGYLVPNAFTPNGDGKNDCFGVQTWGYVTDFSLSVFNRWGQRIFYTTKPSDCWDGTYKGKEQNPDVYVYQITAKGFCGDIYRKGTFTLIR